MQPSAPPSPPRRSHRSRSLAIVAIVVILIVIVAFVAVGFRFTTVDVTVISDQTLNTVTFTFMFDGRQVGSGVLAPGQKTLYSVPLAWWCEACHTHSYSASSTGGASGPTHDDANVTVCAGTSYARVLSV